MIAVDLAFDEALQQLSQTRIAYEDDPCNPDLIAALGAARTAPGQPRAEPRSQ